MPSAPRPFQIRIDDAKLEAIRGRLASSRLPYRPDDDADWRYGIDVVYLSEFIEYWRERYDWRAAERELNRYPQFKCDVEGVELHFLHIRTPGATQAPTLLLTHGWPGSTYEFHAAAERLAYPESFGGEAGTGFDLVIPSLPGYGFSGRPPRPIGPRRVAALWRSLMVDHLGIDRFGVQGGDWGSGISAWLANDAPDHVIGLHLNLCSFPATDDPSPEEQAWRAQIGQVLQRESAYMMEQMTKPQTIAAALCDNPVGYAAWVLEKFHGWGDIQGNIESRFSKDWLITNLMIHLVNDAVTSMIWMYSGGLREIMDGRHRGLKVAAPTAGALFPAEFMPWPPRKVAERCFNVRRWTEMAAGGHFAALEEPRAFAEDVAAFFNGLAKQRIPS